MAYKGRTEDILLNKMWRTKSSRFNASQRIRKIYGLSIWTTSMLSFYVFCTSLATIFVPVYNFTSNPTQTSQYFSIITLILSVFLIIITLLESNKRYLKDSETMLKSANDIGELYNLFQSYSEKEKENKRTDSAKNYNKIIKALTLDHKDVDYLSFLIQHNSELKISRYDLFFYRIRHFLLSIGEYGIFAFMIFMPLAASIYTLFL